MPEEPLNERLASRVGAFHLRQRQGMQRDHVTRIFGRGRNFFHIENWYSVHALMRMTMRITGTYRRGQRNAADIRVTDNRVHLTDLPASFDGRLCSQ